MVGTRQEIGISVFDGDVAPISSEEIKEWLLAQNISDDGKDTSHMEGLLQECYVTKRESTWA